MAITLKSEFSGQGLFVWVYHKTSLSLTYSMSSLLGAFFFFKCNLLTLTLTDQEICRASEVVLLAQMAYSFLKFKFTFELQQK